MNGQGALMSKVPGPPGPPSAPQRPAQPQPGPPRPPQARPAAQPRPHLLGVLQPRNLLPQERHVPGCTYTCLPD